jgi:hypothetical protein
MALPLNTKEIGREAGPEMRRPTHSRLFNMSSAVVPETPVELIVIPSRSQ